jgi:anion-transporting  ArsA/GET3 family ATPase
VEDLLAKRLLFITGKGGVGRSTVAAALGLLAARRGMRTVLAEVAGQERLPRALGGEAAGFEEVELAPRLFTISIDPQHALEEYLRVQMPARAMADLLSSSRMFQYFAAATPGMRELLTIGKLWELTQRQRRTRGAAPYDLTIADAPATGHGLAILRAPGTFAQVARVGPIAHQAGSIQRTIADREHTGVVAVAHAEEMPVAETLALRDALRADPGVPLVRVFVNAVVPDRFSPRQATRIARASDTAGTPAARAALRAALSGHARARGQREQVARLRDGLGAEPVLLPLVVRDDGERAVFERLADALEETVAAEAAA